MSSSHGEELDKTDARSLQLLRKATRESNLQRVEELIVDGADVDSRGTDSWTPLHLAAKYKSIEVAKLLVDNGASIESKMDSGHTPLHLAAQENSFEVAKMSTNDEITNSMATDEVEVLEHPLSQDSKVLENTVTDEDKWFSRLEECLQRTDFIQRLASCKSGAIPDTTYEEEDYIVVGRDDPIQEMANTIASCIVQCPEAQDLSPIELQNAVLKACKDIKKSKGRSYWGWCKAIYRSASWGYTAVQFCANPWAVLAICRAICMFPKTFFLRFFL